MKNSALFASSDLKLICSSGMMLCNSNWHYLRCIDTSLWSGCYTYKGNDFKRMIFASHADQIYPSSNVGYYLRTEFALSESIFLPLKVAKCEKGNKYFFIIGIIFRIVFHTPCTGRYGK